MNRAPRKLVAALLALACAPADPASTGSGGTSSGSGGSTSSSGGSTSSSGGGTSSSGGGTSSSGGSTSSSGGSTSSSGGSTSSSGGSTSSSGGSTSSSGGSTSSSGGSISSSGGSTSSSGGSTSSSGGATGSGGGAGKGGATGSGGASSSSCTTANETKFSFFVISNAELIRQGGEDTANKGFSKYGGNFGGIVGADKICQTAAEHVSPCQSSKVWHAFLGTTTEDPINRIGKGPWYDRNGRLWSANLTNLVGDRPMDADAAIKNDIPNENGVRNQNPEGSGNVDNHEIVTGAGSDGKIYTQSTTGGGGFGDKACGADVGGSGTTWSAERATCWNWTRNTNEGCPRMGRSWCMSATCMPAGSGSGTSWMSAWNGVGCAPGGTMTQTGAAPAGSRKIGAAGGYGGFYCFAVVNP